MAELPSQNSQQTPPQVQPRRVLIVRPSALGDVCRSVPVLASLRAALPEAHIAWVVQDDFAPAIEAHPALSEVIAFPRSRFAKWWATPARAVEVRRWFADLRKKKFDVAIDCQGLSRSGLIVRASRARMRIGLRSAREFAWLCYNRRVPEDAASPLPVHAVERMLALSAPLEVPAVRDMRLYVPDEAAAWWTSRRSALGLDGGAPYAVIAPGSRWPSKRWPIERFGDLIEPLLQRGYSRVVVIGSPAERDQMRPLLEKSSRPRGIKASSGPENHMIGDQQAMASDNESMPRCLDASMPSWPVIDLVGSTSIAQTMAIIAGAGMVIANDSAPLHIAVGFDRPCIALFGPTDPAAVGPYARAECVVRAYQPVAGEPIHYKETRLGDSLMRLISTAMVLQAVDRVLALWPQRSRAFDASSPRAALNGEMEIDVPRGLHPEAAS